MSEQRTEHKWVWLEEYKRCSCSFLAWLKADLMGYCSRHGTERRRATKIPGKSFSDWDMGRAGH